MIPFIRKAKSDVQGRKFHRKRVFSRKNTILYAYSCHTLFSIPKCTPLESLISHFRYYISNFHNGSQLIRRCQTLKCNIQVQSFGAFWEISLCRQHPKISLQTLKSENSIANRNLELFIQVCYLEKGVRNDRHGMKTVSSTFRNRSRTLVMTWGLTLCPERVKHLFLDETVMRCFELTIG